MPVAAIEAVEDVRDVLGRDPGAVVLDLEQGVLAIGPGPQRHPRPLGRVRERVVEQRPHRPGARAARRRGRPGCPARRSRRRASCAPRARRTRRETTRATSPRSTGSCSTRIRPASSRERSSRSVASFARRSTCSRIVSRNSCRVASSTLLVRHQLEEAAEREERRAQLVRGVGDELAARAVELAEPPAHPLERVGQVSELVVARVDHRLVEAAARDPLGRALEPQDALRVHRGDAGTRRRRRRGGRSGPRTGAVRSISFRLAIGSASESLSRITTPSFSSGTATSANRRPPRSTVPRSTVRLRVALERDRIVRDVE